MIDRPCMGALISGCYMGIENSDFLDLFLDEAEDILSRIESTIITICEIQDQESYDRLFRDIHTLKGSSKAVGLEDFGNFIHRIEDLVSRLKAGDLDWSHEAEKIASRSLDTLESWVEGLRDDPKLIIETSEITDSINVLLNDQGPNDGKIRGLTLFEQDKSDGTVDKNIGDILKDEGKVSQLQLSEAARIQNRKFGEVLVEEGMVKADDVQNALKKQKNSSKANQSRKSIRIAQEKVDRLMKSVNQLVIFQSVIAKGYGTQTFDSEIFGSAVQQASKVASEIQDLSFSFRLQPVESMFQKLTRVIKDVARDTKKSIEVNTIGTDVELDKFVLEQLQDPLVHIVRNAVDHGIEADRSAKEGKAGKILLKAENFGSMVVITVSDDGKGIDPAVVRAKAIDKNLIKPSEELSENQIFDLIMMPGFSTAETVTTFSGRGVGMNVVKSSIEQCGGSIDIESKVGQGSKFTIKLPTSIGIIKSLIVSCKQRKYAVPLSEVSEILNKNECDIKSAADGGMFSLRGKIIPVQDLSEYININESLVDASGKEILLVAAHKNQNMALACDQMHGVEDVIINDLSSSYEGCKGVSGMTILPNGEPSLIVSISEICKSYFHKYQSDKGQTLS